MQLVGKIKRVTATKQISDSFKARELHIETEEQFSQTLNIQFAQDKAALLDTFQPGQKVKVDINIKGREVLKEGEPARVFNTIQGWKIEKVA